MKDWSGHIDVVVLVFLELIFNVFIYRKIKTQRSIIYYGKDEHKPSRHDSAPTYSSGRLDRLGYFSKRLFKLSPRPINGGTVRYSTVAGRS